MLKNALVISLAGFFAASSPAADTGAAQTAAPYSESVMAGDTLYISGHIGLDAVTGQAASNAETEAHLVMDAVKHTVEHAGLTMDDVVAMTVYCTDLDLYEKFNAVYRTYFHGQYPTRAFIGVNKLVRGAHFEVAGIAAKRMGPRKL